jgi:hypothetical protein
MRKDPDLIGYAGAYSPDVVRKIVEIEGRQYYAAKLMCNGQAVYGIMLIGVNGVWRELDLRVLNDFMRIEPSTMFRDFQEMIDRKKLKITDLKLI